MLALPQLIALSMVALVLGALLGILFKEQGWGLAALKGLMASFLGGLLVIHLLPQAYEKLGPMSLVWMLVGFLLMVVPEKLASHGHQDGDERFFTAEILWMGLVFHQITDGMALGVASEDLSNDFTLALMVIAHRIPVAAVVVWLFRRRHRSGHAWLRIGAMGVATVVGALFAQSLAPILDSVAVNIFYAIVAGSFLHLVTHDFLDHHAHAPRDRRWEFLAFVIGLAMLALTEGLMGGAHVGAEGGHSHHGFEAFLHAFLILIKETAPYLLLGLFMSGLLHAYMPSSPINWLRRGGTTTQSFKGMAFGLPLPICSCGVLPLFLSLSRKGVPPACLVAFLIATPELGIDSFLLSVKLLGWKFSLVRLVTAMILPIAIALIAAKFLSNPVESTPKPASCCQTEVDTQGKSWWRFAAVDLVDDIFPFVIFGLVIAALAQVMWPVSTIAEWVGVWDVVLLGLVGIPFYVCASASIPFALILLQHGFSIGAVVVFLFAGPATNVATILTVNKAFGPRSGLKLAGTALAVAVVVGFIINAVYQPESLDVIELHDHGWSVLDMVSVTGLLLLGMASLYRSGPLHWISNVVGMIPGVVHHPPTEDDHQH